MAVASTVRSDTISGLTNGVAYEVRVFATNSEGNSELSAAVSATPKADTAPGTPKDLEVVKGTTSADMVITWAAPDDDGGQAVNAYDVGYRIGNAAFSSAPISGLTTTITGLALDTEFDVRVAATNPIGTGAYAEVEYKTPASLITGSVTFRKPNGDPENRANNGVEIVVKLDALPANVPAGSSVELYLEDDYQVPDSIANNLVFFVAKGSGLVQGSSETDAEFAVRLERESVSTGSASPVYGTAPIQINDGDHFSGDDDWSILVVIPDMCTSDVVVGGVAPCLGPNGPTAGQTLEMVIMKAAGIRNPTEEADRKSGIAVLQGTDTPNGGASSTQSEKIVAHTGLSDDDNGRGYELIITGSGFNDKTTGTAYLLQAASAPATCEALVGASGSTIIGSGLVGSDDKVAITTEVSVPTFDQGAVNHICIVDGENRFSGDVETFELEESIRAVPNAVSSGDTVNLFASDFASDTAFTELKLSGITVWLAGRAPRDQQVELTGANLVNGAATISFEVPGSVGGEPLQGTVRVDAIWGSNNDDTKITVTGSEVTASETDVLPNETITITGNGFGSQTCIDVNDIQLDGVAVEVDEESMVDCNADDIRGNFDAVEVSNSGQFVATITLWPADMDAPENPTLISGSHTLSVVDTQGFVGSTSLMIAEPTISVVPDVVGPRDYIVITGTNWPVDNSDNSNAGLVGVRIEDDNRGRDYSVYTDGTGRFTVEHRVSKDVAIPSTVQITGTYSDVVKVGSFAIPAATITVDPADAQPGDLIGLSATDMKPYASADEVKIGGSEVNFTAANTDFDGNITLTDLLVPGLDPGVYSVVLRVDGTVAIGELNVLAEDSARGAGAMLPDALSEVGDNLVRVFHFNGVDKSWDFYDPRADFADLNTLTTMVNGEPYWILVSEGQENVVLNNRARTLTCVGGDCWNQLVW